MHVKFLPQAIITGCDACSKKFSGDETLKKIDSKSSAAVDAAALSPLLQERDRAIRELELELAQTKLALVESECRVQDLTHELNATVADIHESKSSTWLSKTLSSLREVTSSAGSSSKKDGGGGGGGASSSATSGVNNKDGGAGRRDGGSMGGFLSKSVSREMVQRKESKDNVTS